MLLRLYMSMVFLTVKKKKKKNQLLLLKVVVGVNFGLIFITKNVFPGL